MHRTKTPREHTRNPQEQKQKHTRGGGGIGGLKLCVVRQSFLGSRRVGLLGGWFWPWSSLHTTRGLDLTESTEKGTNWGGIGKERELGTRRSCAHLQGVPQKHAQGGTTRPRAPSIKSTGRIHGRIHADQRTSCPAPHARMSRVNVKRERKSGLRSEQHEGFAADREKMNALRSTGPRQDEHA